MKSATEARRWLRDAEACLVSAERAYQAQDYRVAAQNAQLCVEQSAKSVIAHVAEPLWRHDPSPQLRRLVKTHAETIVERCDDEMVAALLQLADDAEEAAPWHGWATYGREGEQGWLPAVDLCTQADAQGLLERARRAYPLAKRFADRWSPQE